MMHNNVGNEWVNEICEKSFFVGLSFLGYFEVFRLFFHHREDVSMSGEESTNRSGVSEVSGDRYSLDEENKKRVH